MRIEKKHLIFAILFLMISLMILLILLSHPRKIGLYQPKVLLVEESENPHLVISFNDHPPWAESHYTIAEVDRMRKTVNIHEYYVALNPFAKPIRSLPSVVLSHGQMNPLGLYIVQYWDGEKMCKLGELEVGEEKLFEWKSSSDD